MPCCTSVRYADLMPNSEVANYLRRAKREASDDELEDAIKYVVKAIEALERSLEDR